MKLFVLAFALLATSAFAHNFDDVKPIVYFPSFWDNKPAELRPPPSFFENYERTPRNITGRIVGGQIAQ